MELINNVHHFAHSSLNQVSSLDFSQDLSEPQWRIFSFFHDSNDLHPELESEMGNLFLNVTLFLLGAEDDERKVEFCDLKNVFDSPEGSHLHFEFLQGSLVAEEGLIL